MRDDSSSLAEIDVKYPAVADYDVIDCLVDTAEELGIKTNLGINYSTDSFYRKVFKDDPRDEYTSHNIVDTEDNESAIILVLSSLYGAKAASVLTVDGFPLLWARGGYLVGEKAVDIGIEKMMGLGVKAASTLTKRFFNN